MMKNVRNSQIKSMMRYNFWKRKSMIRKQLLEENSCRTQSKLAQELGVTRQAISKRLHKLGRIQEEDHWVPHELTVENKRRR